MVTNRATVPFQSVFRIDVRREPGAHNQTRVFVPRKAHRKSRDGCHGCKKRRLKCDEMKPQCAKCAKLRTECHYPQSSSPSDKSQFAKSSPQTVTSDMYSMATDLVDTDLGSLLFTESSLGREGSLSQYSTARMLQHFQSVTSLTLGCSSMQGIMQSFVGSHAWSHPSLMHLVLAMSCAHQRHLSHDSTQSSLELAEATHWERGLQLHRQHLAAIKPGHHNGNWDTVMAAFFLQIMITFSLQDDVHTDQSLCSQDTFARTIDPLAAIGGFNSLFYLYGSWQPRSKWSQILESTDDGDGTFSSPAPGIDGLPRAFVDLCELDADSTVENNPYHRIVRILTPCLRLKPSTENYATLFACLGRVWPNMKTLLLRRDPRGMLLVAYWFAMLRQIDQWWLTKRARSECRAIVAYLAALNEPAISALLPFPAAFEWADIGHMWRLLGYILEDSLPRGD